MTAVDQLRAAASYLETHGLTPISVCTAVHGIDLHLRWPDYLRRVREEGRDLQGSYQCATDTHMHFGCDTTTPGVVVSGLLRIAPDSEGAQ